MFPRRGGWNLAESKIDRRMAQSEMRLSSMNSAKATHSLASEGARETERLQIAPLTFY